MCGIVGFSGINNPELLTAMNASLTHRGPDDLGEFIDKQKAVSLAMRRLSIIDLTGGHQPMCNEDGTIWIVFNGEIFNFKQLRNNLTACGHKFKSDHSDTEVLVHLYEEKRESMLLELNGMFSFVIYDQRKGLLFGARDRTGIKPLYYALKNNVFLFASELKALLLYSGISKDLNFQSLYDYFSFQFVPADGTIFKDIQKIPAAHYFVFDINSGNIQFKRYWDIPEFCDERIKLNDAVDGIRHRLKEAVSDWSLSDVPLACSLSGGIDSSSVLGLLCSSGARNIETYSLGFQDKHEQNISELKIAGNTANYWGVKHHETILNPDDLLGDLEEMIWHLDEPYAGGLPSWYVFKAMQGKVKVALTGTGGDELFGNYGKWKPYESLFSNLRQKAKFAILDNSLFGTLKMIRQYPQGYLYHRYFTENMKRKYLFNEQKLKAIRPTEKYLQDIWSQAGNRSPRDIIPYIDFKLQLPEEFLQMTDRFSMAHSIEARTPFLDHRLIELVMSIPGAIRTNACNLKYLLVESVSDILPKEVIRAPKKGFVLPINRWLKGPLKDKVEYYLGENYLKKQGLFSKAVYKNIVQPYFRGRKYLDDFVWTVLMFQLWHKKFIKNDRFS